MAKNLRWLIIPKTSENRKVDRVYIIKEDRRIYDKLKEEPSSPLQKNKMSEKVRNRVRYMVALVIGFTEGNRVKDESISDGFVRLDTLKEKDKAIIKAIAVVEEGDLSILTDKQKVYEIADQYAASGIHILKEKALGSDLNTYLKKLEAKLIEKYRENKSKLSS